jgi:hypothetical protein
MKYTNQLVKGAEFSAKKKVAFFRPTTMSIAMAAAGIIPAPHLVREFADMALIRSQNDTKNLRPSISLAF